jgi:hypothetical protein
MLGHPDLQTLHLKTSFCAIVLSTSFMLPLQELKIQTHGAGISSEQSVDSLWLARGKNWNFDRMLSLRRNERR